MSTYICIKKSHQYDDLRAIVWEQKENENKNRRTQHKVLLGLISTPADIHVDERSGHLADNAF